MINMIKFRLRDMTWRSFEEYCIKNSCIGILPIGSIEQHGDHLPLGTDLFIADKLAEIAATKALERNIRAIVLEPIAVTISREWSGNPGTLWVSGEVFQAYLKNYLFSVFRNRINRVVVLNAHGGNFENLLAALKNTVYDYEERGFRVYLVNWWDMVGDVINEVFETRFFHADEIETSLALALGICCETREVGERITRPYETEWYSNDLAKRNRVYVFYKEGERREKGSFGRPDLASREKGVKLLNVFLERFLRFLEDVYNNKI